MVGTYGQWREAVFCGAFFAAGMSLWTYLRRRRARGFTLQMARFWERWEYIFAAFGGLEFGMLMGFFSRTALIIAAIFFALFAICAYGLGRHLHRRRANVIG